MVNRIVPLILLWVPIPFGGLAPGWANSAESSAEGRLAVALGPGPYHVGQGVGLTVRPAGTDASDEPPGAIAPPRVAGADLIALASGTAGRTDYVLVPRRPGTLTIPPFRGRRGTSPVASPPVTIAVGPIPQAGRSAAYLGGVGDLQLTSQVEPAQIRLGQVVEYQLRLGGPAAWGSERAPALPPLPAALTIREATAERTGTNPPVRIFRYLLRAIEPGRAVVPPITVASFDPTSGRFLTRSAPSQVVTIEPPPGFDASRVDFGPNRRPGRGRPGLGLGLAAGTLLAAVGALGIAWWWHRRAIQAWWDRRRANRPPDWRRAALGLAAAAEGLADHRVVAEGIAVRFASGLSRATGRPVAVLTPPEAVATVARLTADPGLADRAGDLAMRLDEIRFDRQMGGHAAGREAVRREVLTLLETLASRTKRPGRGIGRSDGRADGSGE